MTTKNKPTRYSAGELFGYDLLRVSQAKRIELAEQAIKSEFQTSQMICPFQSGNPSAFCTKKGGVCTMRAYAAGANGEALRIDGFEGALRPACPKRLNHDNFVHDLAGQIMLNVSKPIILAEVPLPREGSRRPANRIEDIGRFDYILIDDRTIDMEDMKFAALEAQSLYFSGDSMSAEFRSMLGSEDFLKFPIGRRRPDDKSSMKRLLSQLQEKVPVIRHWGSKMAIVVDQPFFNSLGDMQSVKHLSNGDIAWIIVGFKDEAEGQSKIYCEKVIYTTLEKTIEILTRGEPMSREDFQLKLIDRISASSGAIL